MLKSKTKTISAIENLNYQGIECVSGERWGSLLPTDVAWVID